MREGKKAMKQNGSRGHARSALLLGAGLMLATMAHAAPIHWGVRGGVSAARFGGEFGELTKSKAKAGLDAGVTLALPLPNRLSLQTGASYLNKGAGADAEATDPFGNPTGAINSRWNFDYVEVPLLLRVDITPSPGLRPYLEAGPSLGILLDGVFESGFGFFGSQSLKDDLKPLDLGYAVGGGVTLPLQSGRLGVGLRYTSAFSDAFDLTNNVEALNRTWSMTLSWSK